MISNYFFFKVVLKLSKIFQIKKPKSSTIEERNILKNRNNPSTNGTFISIQKNNNSYKIRI